MEPTYATIIKDKAAEEVYEQFMKICTGYKANQNGVIIRLLNKLDYSQQRASEWIIPKLEVK